MLVLGYLECGLKRFPGPGIISSKQERFSFRLPVIPILGGLAVGGFLRGEG